MSGSYEQLNAENIESRYDKVLLPDRELIHPRDKYAEFASMCEFPERDIKFPKW